MKPLLHDRYLIDPDRLDTLAPLLGIDPFSSDALDAQRAALSSAEIPREAVSACLSEYNTLINNDQPALDNCHLLAQPDTTAVVTGQQAGLFTGPLYTIYKIATTIRLARDEMTRTGRPVIPIYWNATEDHDISEIASCRLPGKTIEADFPKSGIAGERLTTECLKGLITDVIDASPEYIQPFLTDLLSCTHENYGAYSSSVIARLFKGTGLVILEPRILRPLAQTFFQQVLASQPALHRALKAGSTAMKDYDLDPAFEPGDGTGLFYINTDGIRRQIRSTDVGYLVDDNDLTQAQLDTLLSDEVESISTGAWLRPVLQCRLLPVLAYIAGPSEFTYHLQLPEVFKELGVAVPPVRLRNHATLLSPVEERLASQLELSNDDFFKGPEPFYTTPELPDDYAAAFSRGRSTLEALGSDLQETLAALNCERPIEGFINKTLKDFQKLETRAAKDSERQAGVGNKRLDRFFQTVFPGNTLQERRINILYFLGTLGPELPQQLIECFDPNEHRHYIMYPGD